MEYRLKYHHVYWHSGIPDLPLGGLTDCVAPVYMPIIQAIPQPAVQSLCTCALPLPLKGRILPPAFSPLPLSPSPFFSPNKKISPGELCHMMLSLFHHQHHHHNHHHYNYYYDDDDDVFSRRSLPVFGLHYHLPLLLLEVVNLERTLWNGNLLSRAQQRTQVLHDYPQPFVMGINDS